MWQYGALSHRMQRKKENDKFKQRRNGYNRVYSRYRVLNYKNMNNDKNRKTNQQQNEQNNNMNASTSNLLTAMKAIQQNLQEINNTLGNLN